MHFDLAESLAILSRTPRVLRDLLLDLPEGWVSVNEGPDTWNAREVLGHLIHGEDTDWVPRAQIILGGSGSGRFEPFDRFAHLTRFKGRSVPELLDLFAKRRNENLATVEAWRLTPSQLALTGIHPEFGSVTLEQLLATWVVHDLGHLTQIARVMAKRYTAEVGPWETYLSILDR